MLDFGICVAFSATFSFDGNRVSKQMFRNLDYELEKYSDTSANEENSFRNHIR